MGSGGFAPGPWHRPLPHLLDATDIAVVLPDGRIFYCHDSEDPIVFDPVTGAKSEPAGSGTEQGCTNTTLLEDGRVIGIGGQAGGDFRNATQWVKAWSPTLGWSRLADLLQPTGRWYPGLARLADGDLLVMGGGTRPNAERTDTCEIFDQTSGTWSDQRPNHHGENIRPAAWGRRSSFRRADCCTPAKCCAPGAAPSCTIRSPAPGARPAASSRRTAAGPVTPTTAW